MQDRITSYIRTISPIIVGALIAWLAKKNITVDEAFEGQLVIALTALIQGAYYVVARLIGKKYPQVEGVLLGSAKQPVYKEVK